MHNSAQFSLILRRERAPTLKITKGSRLFAGISPPKRGHFCASGQGLTFQAAYTFSKSIDDVSSVFGGSVGSGWPQDSYDTQFDRWFPDFNVFTVNLPAPESGSESRPSAIPSVRI
jgi:hypothetical protein